MFFEEQKYQNFVSCRLNLFIKGYTDIDINFIERVILILKQLSKG